MTIHCRCKPCVIAWQDVFGCITYNSGRCKTRKRYQVLQLKTLCAGQYIDDSSAYTYKPYNLQEVVVKKALSTFGFTMIGLDPNLEEELPSDMSEFASRLRAFDIGKRRLIETDIAVANEAYRMYDDWMILRTKYRENRPLSALLDKSQGICVNLQTAAMGNTQLVIKQRVEPVILMFRGGSGVGKSTLMYHLVQLCWLKRASSLNKWMTLRSLERLKPAFTPGQQRPSTGKVTRTLPLHLLTTLFRWLIQLPIRASITWN